MKFIIAPFKYQTAWSRTGQPKDFNKDKNENENENENAFELKNLAGPHSSSVFGKVIKIIGESFEKTKEQNSKLVQVQFRKEKLQDRTNVCEK